VKIAKSLTDHSILFFRKVIYFRISDMLFISNVALFKQIW